MRYTTAVSLILFVLVVVVGLGSMYVVPEGQQVVVTQFGKPVRAVTDAGLCFKIPFVQEVHRLEKRLLPWDGDAKNMPTKDKRRVLVDVWARWRIVDPMTFFTAVRSISEAEQRLSERVDSAVRAVVASHNLIEVVRTSNNPLQYESEELERDWASRSERITAGRREMEQQIQQVASKDLRETFGMELSEVHLKRTNYIQSVREKVYERMRSERMRIATLYESEAVEEKNRILGQMRKVLDEIEGEMKQRASEIRGDADARVIQITAESFGRNPSFYAFLRRLEAYKATLGKNTHMVLSTDSSFLSQLHEFTESEGD